MLTAIEEEAADHLNFSAFKGLEQTRDEIAQSSGTLQYIPSPYPLPYGTKLLEPLADSTTRVFRPPRTILDLEEIVHRSIEYLVNNPESGSCLLWCSPELIDRISEIDGSQFVNPSRVELTDSYQVLREVFQHASGVIPQNVEDIEAGEFVFRACLAAALRADPKNIPIEPIPDADIDELHISNANLRGEIGPVEQFYLRTIGIERPELFSHLTSTAQENVHTVRFKETYGDAVHRISNRARKLEDIQSLSKEVQITLFRMAFKHLCTREEGDSMDSVAPSIVDRRFISELREGFGRLVEDEHGFSASDPLETGKHLVPYFGLLATSTSLQELAAQMSFARSQLGDQVEGFKDEKGYDETIRNRIVSKWDRFFSHLGEVALIRSIGTLNRATEIDAWSQDLEPIIEYVETTDDVEFNHPYFEPIKQAKTHILAKHSASERAREISDTVVSLENVQSFLDEWTQFVATVYPNKAPSDDVTAALVNVYDRFVDEVVSSYADIVDGEDYMHISDIIESSRGDGVTVTVVVDSFGYTDYKFVQHLADGPNLKPDDVGIVYSNIPSYTPSAMSTLLTGYPPHVTGIYGWHPVSDGLVHPLKLPLDDEEVPKNPNSTIGPYTLIQQESLEDSGLTTFARQAADIRLASRTISQSNEILEDVRTGLSEQLGEELSRRLRSLRKFDESEPAYQAQHDTFVLYLKEFDELLHERFSIENFNQYYIQLDKFLSRLVDDLRREITQAYDEAATGELIHEDVRLILTADHGKLTKYEREDIISPGNKSHEFSNRTLEGEGIELKEAHRIEFGKLEVSSKGNDPRPYLALVEDFPYPPIDRVKKYLNIGEEEEERRSDEDIARLTEDIQEALSVSAFKNNGAKFMFAFLDDSNDTVIESIANQPGIDLIRPPPSGIYDSPDIGVVSRYQPKHNPTDHGHHGGTSLSEMAGAWLEFRVRQ